ncbi:hypothetical protein GCM10009827_103540 [Dactylosporangium maewongense]|uniref:DUF4878 domain-containing protein n=1 Tax=Dactylosporangium maewongense TaxID=634393 RepID=A0ABP4NPB9_9ACTN
MAMQFEYTVPQPPRRNTTLRTVLIVVGVLAVLCCGGGGVGAYFLFNKVADSTSAAQAAAEAYVGALESGDFAAAYGLACAATRGEHTQDDYVAALGRQPKIQSHKVVGTFIRNVNGKTSADITMDVVYAEGSPKRYVFTLVEEGDAWKVCGVPS